MTTNSPIILAIDDQPEVLGAVLRDLRAQYAERYAIVGAGSGEEAIEILEEMALKGRPLALVVADQRMPRVTGIDVL